MDRSSLLKRPTQNIIFSETSLFKRFGALKLKFGSLKERWTVEERVRYREKEIKVAFANFRGGGAERDSADQSVTPNDQTKRRERIRSEDNVTLGQDYFPS